jgi:hypothetical protein
MIMTTALSVIFGGYAVSLRAVRDSEATTRALFFAEQKLAEVRAAELVPGGETTGGFPDRDDYRWNLAYRETTVPSLYLAQIEIVWSEKGSKKIRSTTVETLQYYSSEE